MLAIALIVGTVACLGTVVGLKAKAETPTITNLDGIERTPGQHRGLDKDGNPRTAPLTKSELAELYPAGYSYLSGWAYEIDTSDGYTPNYDFQNHMTETDGYVQPGDYIVLLIKFTTSYPYMGNLTGWFTHTYDFFENINTDNDGLTDLTIKPLNSSNTNLETYGCIMNPLQADVPAATAKNDSNITKSGWTADELDTIGVNVYVGGRTGSTIYYQNEDDLWSLAIMYRVRTEHPDAEHTPLEDGEIGSIFLPATQDPNKGMFKVPVTGMTKAQAAKKTGTLAVSENGTKAVNSHEVPNFDYQDFGVTLCIGEPSSQGKTYTATFYDEAGENVLGTITDIRDGQSIDAIESPADTATTFFKGWSTVKGDESAIVTFPQTITENVKYYAIYSEATPITLVFGDTEVRAFNGDTIESFPTAPAITGKDFKGWSTTEGDASAIVTLPYSVNTTESEIVFYPIYETSKFTVTFDMNGGNENNVVIKNVEYGKAASTIVPSGDFTKTGFNFAGWSTSNTATAPDADLGAITEDTTFFAVWTAKEYSVRLYLTEDAADPYMTFAVTYGGSSPKISANDDKPSKQAGAPENSIFAAWVNKATGDTVSTTELRPAGTASAYTIDGDLDVYVRWTSVSTFSFYIPSVENEGEWVLVDTYSQVTASTWTTIKTAFTSKATELGYAYQTSATTATEKQNLAKWATNPEGTEGIVSLDGKNADGGTVVTVNDPVTNTAFYIVGKRLSNTDVLAGEDGPSLLDDTQRTGQYETNPVNILLDKIAENAPEGKEFAGYFVDENGNEVETEVSASFATFALPYGQHTYYPAWQDIVYTIVFSIDGYVATADVVYGETLTVNSEEIVPYESYTGFPVIPENIPDIDADPSKSVELYDKTLKDWNKDGYIITGWEIIYDGQAVATLDNENPYPVNPDHSYVPNLGEFSGKHVININATVKPLYYEATFDCGQVKAKFPDGSTVQKLWIATGTGASAIREMTEAAFGVPVKENCTFMSWQPNEPMGAEATTFVPMIYGKPVKIFFVYGDLGEEGLNYEAIYNGEATDYMVLNKYCEQDGSTLLEEGAEMVDPYSWAPYSLLMGWSVAPAYTFTNEEGEEIEFVDRLGPDDVIKGNMIFTTSYKPFEDCWLIIYDSNTSYLIGSILEGIIDKERAINELFNFTGEPAAPGKIEELVGDYTGRTIEQILSEELQKSFNANIYKTVGKDFSKIYWHEGKQVDKKDAVVNANAEEEIIIWYQFKLINFNLKKLFSREMWQSVYIVGRPVTIPKAWLDPSQTAQTLETIINVVKGLLG